MTDVSEAALNRAGVHRTIQVADQALVFRPVAIDDATPTGAQLAAAAGFHPAQTTAVLQIAVNGEMEDIQPDQVVDLAGVTGEFVIVATDRLYFLKVDGERFEWPCRIVSGAVVRKLGRVGPDQDLYLERPDRPGRLITDRHLVDLDEAGVETFQSRKREWKLNVQGVILDVVTPTIVVKDAIERAGFNPDAGWQIFLKVAGEPKRKVELTTVIDLRTPGIEKLRLTPNEVNNGEATIPSRRDFDLLDADEVFLDGLMLRWETVEEASRRWLVIHQYPVPQGYTVDRTTLALEIPPSYPGAQIYGFFAYPPLALAGGGGIASTQLRGVIFGVEYHGWSRNRGSTPWNPATDNVRTQLALADAALGKEVGL